MAVRDNIACLRGVAQRFAQFRDDYAPFFQTKTRDGSEIAGQYLNGLVQASKRNMERMEEKVPESNGQALHHFITNSPWDERAVLRKVATDANQLIGGTPDSCFLIDETSFVKKGPKSVGVGRQYCGRTGKVDNCQVAVFGALVAGDKSLPIDHRLYLPKEWTEDPKRCEAAGIPADKIDLKSKCQLAIDIIRTAKDNGVDFKWVGADAGYGKDPGFLGDLWALNLDFVIDVHRSQFVYHVDPSDVKVKPLTLEKWVSEQADETWQELSPRDCVKGKLVFEYVHGKFWIKGSRDDDYRQVRVIVRRSRNSKQDYKFSVSNVDDSISLQRLAYMQGQRFWIERAFEDAKGSLGMSEYQLRKWRGWHHHMALISMAHLFLLKERMRNEESLPLLSMQDIVTMLAFYLPQRDTTEEEMFRQLAARHAKRRRDMRSML